MINVFSYKISLSTIFKNRSEFYLYVCFSTEVYTHVYTNYICMHVAEEMKLCSPTKEEFGN